MKFLVLATLLISISAFADQKEENVAKVKAAISANIDQKISALQSHKSCIQGASDREQLKSCRDSHKEAMKKLHEENKSEREAWKASKEERKEKRKDEKKSEKSN